MVQRAPLLAGLVVAIVLAGLPAVALGPPVTQEACPDAPEPVPFASGLDRLENLAFDGDGHLYVSSIDGDLRRFTQDGSFEVVATADRPLGGLAFAPDGALYLGVSVGFPTPLPFLGLPLLVQSGESEVWRFDSLFPPRHEIYLDGLDSANGLTTDDAGNLYIGELGDAILRVPPEGEPEAWADVAAANGLTLTPDRAALYAAITFSTDSRIERIELADPASHGAVASLSGAEALQPKGLDDLDVAPDGTIYVTGHLSGELVRVDGATGAACVLADGFSEPSSVAIASGFGPYGGDLFVTTFDGHLFVVPTR